MTCPRFYADTHSDAEEAPVLLLRSAPLARRLRLVERLDHQMYELRLDITYCGAPLTSWALPIFWKSCCRDRNAN